MQWKSFFGTENKSIQISCETFGQHINSHFNDIIKTVESGVAPIPTQDFQLSRYACYLITLNHIIFFYQNDNIRLAGKGGKYS